MDVCDNLCMFMILRVDLSHRDENEVRFLERKESIIHFRKK